MKTYSITGIITAIFSSIIVMLGGWDSLLIAIFTLICLDYITGIAAATYKGKLNSYTGYRGILKKVIILCMVALGAAMDNCLFANEPYARSLIIFFYLSNEGISIIENAASAGVPVPQPIINALEQIKAKEK